MAQAGLMVVAASAKALQLIRVETYQKQAALTANLPARTATPRRHASTLRSRCPIARGTGVLTSSYRTWRIFSCHNKPASRIRFLSITPGTLRQDCGVVGNQLSVN